MGHGHGKLSLSYWLRCLSWDGLGKNTYVDGWDGEACFCGLRIAFFLGACRASELRIEFMDALLVFRSRH